MGRGQANEKGAARAFFVFCVTVVATGETIAQINPSTDMYRAQHAPSLIAMPKPPKIPESVLVVIHTPGLDVLLIERADRAGFWQSVTGSKETLDEPLASTAIREVAEETGIVIGSSAVPREALLDWQYQIEYEIYPVWRHRYAEGVTHNTEHWFSLEVPQRCEVTLAPLEHTAHLWLPHEEAAERCFSSSNADAILQLPKRLKRRLR
jgi:dATP pyrophosphohydrolase